MDFVDFWTSVDFWTFAVPPCPCGCPLDFEELIARLSFLLLGFLQMLLPLFCLLVLRALPGF